MQQNCTAITSVSIYSTVISSELSKDYLKIEEKEIRKKSVGAQLSGKRLCYL